MRKPTFTPPDAFDLERTRPPAIRREDVDADRRAGVDPAELARRSDALAYYAREALIRACGMGD